VSDFITCTGGIVGVFTADWLDVIGECAVRLVLVLWYFGCLLHSYDSVVKLVHTVNFYKLSSSRLFLVVN